MKFIIQLILIALLAWLLQSFFPWWSAVIATFLVGLFIASKSGFQAFLASFLGILLLWMTYALVIDINSGSILTEKIAKIFTVNNKYLLIAITGIIGGLPSGFGALSGNMLAKLFQKKKSSRHYS